MSLGLLYYVAELPFGNGFVRYLRTSTKFEISSQNLIFEAPRSICYSPPYLISLSFMVE